MAANLGAMAAVGRDGQCRVSLAQQAGRLGRRVGGHGFDRRELPGQEPAALGGGHGDRCHPLDIGERGPGTGHQMEVDIEDHLSLDPQIEVEDQAVDDVPDGAFDGVLHGDESEVDLAQTNRVQHLGQRPQRDDLSRGVLGLAEQRLFGEGALGPEEPDTRR